MHAVISASDGVVAVVSVEPEGGVDAVVVEEVVAADVEESVGEGVDPEDSEGKKGAHRARAADACPRSAAIALWALETRCWALARPWSAPAAECPDGLATLGLAVGVDVRAGVALGELLAVVLAVWSDSRVASAWARAAFAAVTALVSGRGSRVARL